MVSNASHELLSLAPSEIEEIKTKITTDASAREKYVRMARALILEGIKGQKSADGLEQRKIERFRTHGAGKYNLPGDVYISVIKLATTGLIPFTADGEPDLEKFLADASKNKEKHIRRGARITFKLNGSKNLSRVRKFRSSAS